MKERIYLFDNIKAISILLVVIGHVAQIYANTELNMRVIHIFIYFFHMPVFIFVTGYFSKNVDKCRRNSFKNYLVLYIVFNTIWYAFNSIVDQTIIVSILIPGYALWFLLALFIWRILLKDLITIRYIFVYSIVLGIIIGGLSEFTNIVAMSKVVYYLPFFLMGYYTNERLLEKFKKVKKVFGLVWFAMLFALAYYIGKTNLINYDFLYFSQSFRADGITNIRGVVLRMITYIIAFISIVCFISLTPKKEKFFSYIGKSTISIYLFHVYIIKILSLNITKANDIYIGIIGTVLVSLIIVFLLSTNVVNNFYRFTVRIINKLFIEKHTEV